MERSWEGLGKGLAFQVQNPVGKKPLTYPGELNPLQFRMGVHTASLGETSDFWFHRFSDMDDSIREPSCCCGESKAVTWPGYAMDRSRRNF